MQQISRRCSKFIFVVSENFLIEEIFRCLRYIADDIGRSHQIIIQF
jgi:hypothetical protein